MQRFITLPLLILFGGVLGPSFSPTRDGAHTTVFAAQQNKQAQRPDELQALLQVAWEGLHVLLHGRAEGTVIADTREAARTALELIEAGQTLEQKQTFSSQRKEEVLGWLNYTLGLICFRLNEYATAASYFYRATQFEGWVKRDPQIYSMLAKAYEEGEYRRLVDPFRHDYGGAETVESKARREPVERMIDLIMDAYARAVALVDEAEVKTEQKQAWKNKLRSFYQYRKGTEARMDEFITSILSKPVPDAQRVMQQP